MQEDNPQGLSYKFGEFLLLADERMVLRGEERVHMTPRVFHVLRILLENAGHLVTKETLLRAVWQDSFVEEGNLNNTVSRLRKVLGEKPNENRFIETVPRVGYRFIADVEVVSDDAIPEKSVPTQRQETAIQDERRPGRGWVIASLAAISLAAIVAAAWYWSWKRPQPIVAADQLQKNPMQKNVPIRLTDNPTDDSRATWTSDGRIRFGRFQGKEPFAYVMNADGTDQHRDSSIANLKTGLWSPDDKKVIFYKERDDSGALYLANFDGSNEVRLPFQANNMEWSPDGTKVVYQFGRPTPDLYVYTFETGKSEVVVENPSFDGDPSFSPDGRRIAFVSGRDGNPEIYVQDLDGSNLHRLTDHPARDAFPTFSPDGTQIVFNSNREDENLDVYIMNADGSGVRRLTTWQSDEEEFPGCWSADGTKIFLISNRSGKDNLYVMNVEPFAPSEILKDASVDLQFPTFSPDGATILFQAEAEDKSGELRLFDIKSGRVSTLLKTTTGDGYPKFSPDGSMVVFQDRIERNGEICLIRADGSGGVKDLTNNPAKETVPSWSPDGSRIVFTSNRDGNYDIFQIYVMDADGSNQHPIYHSNAISAYASWSPDGREIVFANDKEDGRTGNFEIFVMEPETTAPERRLTFRPRYDIYPAFSPDGRRIAFVSSTDGNSEIYLMNADGSGLVRLTRDLAEDSQPAWSPDGSKIIFSSSRNGKVAIYEVVIG